METMNDFAVMIAGTAWLIPLLRYIIRDIRKHDDKENR